jgi:uncharacterized radical SAM protein YgiQ
MGAMDFLPVCRDDMQRRGWDYLDFIFVSGDAYVDHPSFGSSLLTRLLESRGYKVGLICQPDWRDPEAFKVLGRPRLAFLVSGGNMDSLVLHYTAAKKPRSQDYYTPGKAMGKRPDRATIVYCAALRQAYKKAPIVIGGIETSLRRLSHYDYWSDKVRRSILVDSKADLGVYGMGERAILDIADRLNRGLTPDQIHDVRGTFFHTETLEGLVPPVVLEPFETLTKDKKAYAQHFAAQYKNTDPFTAKPLAEPDGAGWIYQTQPSLPVDRKLMDQIYDLPYARNWHPDYDAAGGISALEEVKFSLISTRGCYGACSFCALTFHQGRIIQTRSHESLLAEARKLIKDKDFKGYIHDVGGPTANFRQNACDKMGTKGACTEKRCLAPEVCKNLKPDHSDFLALLRQVRALPGVKKVFVRSGIRFDYLVADPDDTFFKELVQHHVSGQLKVAPEHVSDPVLKRMGKPGHAVFEKFRAKFQDLNDQCGKKQFLVPYFISGHPGSTLKDAVALARYLKSAGTVPEQVQDFYPTPGTLATAMYYSGYDPLTLQPVETAKTPHDKALQRALLQFHLPQNEDLVREALKTVGREDLIGNGRDCLIRPPNSARRKKNPHHNPNTDRVRSPRPAVKGRRP